MSKTIKSNSKSLQFHVKKATNLAIREKNATCTFQLDHKKLSFMNITIGALSMTLRLEEDVFALPLKMWKLDDCGVNQKDAEANLKVIKEVLNDFLDEENRHLIGICGDAAVTSKRFFDLSADCYNLESLSSKCSTHGGFLFISFGINKVLQTLPLNSEFKIDDSILESMEEEYEFWLGDDEKDLWEIPLLRFFKLLAFLHTRPNDKEVSFGSKIHLYKLKMKTKYKNQPNPYRSLDRDLKFKELFGADAKKDESTSCLIIRNDKKNRRTSKMIGQLAASLGSAVNIACSPSFQNLFLEFKTNGSNYQFPSEIMKYLNYFSVENEKLLAIMDSTAKGQDCSLVMLLLFCVDVSLGTNHDNVPLENVLGR